MDAHIASRYRYLGTITVALVMFCACCASSEDSPSDTSASSSNGVDCVVIGAIVPAAEVEVLGDLRPEDEAVVSWALGRFALIELELVSPIEVYFDSSTDLCYGKAGRCLLYADTVSELFICEPEGSVSTGIDALRLTMLHELAHVWHFAQGNGSEWTDLSPIVGGEEAGPGVVWGDQTIERVADTISWGLMDTERRQPRGTIPCDEMYANFVALTGHQPLPPISAACQPADA